MCLTERVSCPRKGFGCVFELGFIAFECGG